MPWIGMLSRIDITFFSCFLLSKRNFGISYLSQDRGGVEVYLSLLSDWDLEAAFVSAAKPYLQLKMDMNLSEDSKQTFTCITILGHLVKANLCLFLSLFVFLWVTTLRTSSVDDLVCVCDFSIRLIALYIFGGYVLNYAEQKSS
jgi:hypothetical protein